MYIYKTTLYHNTDRVFPVPDNNTANTADFVNNHKASAVEVSSVVMQETAFVLDITFEEFDALVASPILWSDVKYTVSDNAYTLHLVSETSL
jgi:hypothetical protein